MMNNKLIGILNTDKQTELYDNQGNVVLDNNGNIIYLNSIVINTELFNKD